MNQVIDDITVPPELAGERLDKAAASLFHKFSRAQIARWIDAGALTVDGTALSRKSKLMGGECLQLHAAWPERESWSSAEPITLSVLYEDTDLLVLDKPAGLVVHPGAGNPAGTLVNGLLHYRPQLALLPRAGIVHRLDKDTSGAMVVAASPAAQTSLSRMIGAREITRRYVCVGEGVMIAGRDVDAPIGRHPQARLRQAVRADGKPAQTELRVRERFRAHTLVDARLGTGRTHQIRVHMQSVGHPLVGDSRYGARGIVPRGAASAVIETLRGFKRQALHAEYLSFAHPLGGSRLEFTVPWPADFAHLVEQLRRDARDD